MRLTLFYHCICDITVAGQQVLDLDYSVQESCCCVNITSALMVSFNAVHKGNASLFMEIRHH